MTAPPARILAIDPGERRTGFAISDELGITAQGIETFTAGPGKDVVEHVRNLAARYTIGTVVMGLPLSMAGKEIEGSERSRALARRLETELSMRVLLRDERMTSREAERVVQAGGGRAKAGDIDRLAAVLLLQSYLDERSR